MPIQFRTPRELLFDYVTDALVEVPRPIIVAKHWPRDPGPRIWACIEGGSTTLPGAVCYVSSIVQLNRWIFSRMATSERAHLKGLLDLSHEFEQFLITSLRANNPWEPMHDDDSNAADCWISVQYDEPLPDDDRDEPSGPTDPSLN